ncbi:MAG: hypothetical protein R2681_13525 [Pyrinomonadaceae bacterium]
MKNNILTIIMLAIVVTSANAQTIKFQRSGGALSTLSSNEGRSARVPGVFNSDTPQLADAVTLPESVEAGKDFEISVTTSGSGCVSAGETEVVSSQSAADIFVYDHTTATRPNVVCTMIFKTFRHTAILRFDERGEAMIRVWGRRQGGDSLMGEPFVIEKPVTVK